MKNAFVKCTRNVKGGQGNGKGKGQQGGVGRWGGRATIMQHRPVRQRLLLSSAPACLSARARAPSRQTVICMRPCLFSDSISTSNALNDFKQFSVSRACLSNESQLHCTK